MSFSICQITSYSQLYLLMFVCMLFLSINTSAQNRKKSFSFSDYKKHTLAISAAAKPIVVDRAIQSVTVKDIRKDTTAVLLTKSSYYSIDNFTAAAENYTASLLGVSNNNAGGRQLVMFIKKLWLTSQYKTASAEDTSTNDTKPGNWLGGLFFKADCYIKTDSFYTPLLRYDTVLTIEYEKMEETGSSAIDSCFKMLVQKIGRFNEKSFPKKLTLAEVEKYNAQSFDVPALKTKSFPKSVYITFDDFRNNKIQYPDFTVQKGELSDQLYIRNADGTESLVRNIWGYSDGENVFIKAADNYFMLTKLGNTFYLKGAKSIQSSKYVKVGSVLTDGFIIGALRPHSKKVKFDIEYLPFQLDMESGEIF